MGNYDGIQVPTPHIPISSSQFGKPVRDAIVDLDYRLAIVEANLVLPAAVNAQGFGNNAITLAANTWGNLVTNPATVQMANANPDFDLIVDVYFGAWMSCSVGDVRAGVSLSGGMTLFPPAPGVNQPVGYGLFPLTTVSTSDQHMGFFQVTIPKNTATVTFAVAAARSNATATAAVNYPTIYVVPRRYQ